MKQPCVITSADCNTVKTQLVREYTGVSIPHGELQAALQLLRTNVHPDVFRAAQRLLTIIDNDAHRIRLIAERMGYSWIAERAPYAAEVVAAYQHAHELDYRNTDITARDLAELYIQIVATCALYDTDLLTQWTAATYAVLAHEKAQKALYRFRPRLRGQDQAFSHEERVSQSLDALTRDMDAFLYHHQPQTTHHVDAVTSAEIEPLHAQVVTNGQAYTFRIPLTLHVSNVLAGQYRIELTTPAYVVAHEAARPLAHIPWQRASLAGMTLSVHTPGQGPATLPVYYHLTPEMLEHIRDRGSAVRTVIGQFGDIRLYPEFGHHTLGTTRLPEDPLVSVRVNNAHVEVSALHPDIDLTVLH